VDEAGVFHQIPRIDDSRPAEIFAREVLTMRVGKELLSPEWAERILSWRHTGFNVHSANAHRGKVRKANRVPVLLRMAEEEPAPVPAKGWAEMIRKVYEVDPLVCPRCGSPAVLMAFMSAGE